MFAKPDLNKKGNFLDQAKAARQERHEEKRRDEMCIKIQAYYRGYSTRKTLKYAVRKELALFLKIPDNHDEDYKPELRSAADVFQLLQRYLVLHKTNTNEQCFDFICKYLLLSMESEDLKTSYVSLALSKDHMLLWIQQIKTILLKCCSYLNHLKPESASDLRSITVYLHMLLTFTSTATWKVFKGKVGEALKTGLNQLCSNLMGELNKKGMYSVFKNLLMRGLARKQVSLKRATLSAIISISLRPLVASNYSQHLMTVFSLQVLAVPAVIHHLSQLAPEVLSSLVNSGFFGKLLDFLCDSQNMRIVSSTLEGNYTLCLLANIVQLGSHEGEKLILLKEKFTFVLTTLLEGCDKCLKNKQNKTTHWHPVLGWLSQKSDQSLYDAMPSVMTQLQLLWCNNLISYMFSDLLTYTQAQRTTSEKAANEPRKIGFWKKITSRNSSSKLPMDSATVVNTCAACQLYQTALTTMSQLKMDILAGLSYNAVLLPSLWVLLNDLGPNFGLKTFLETICSDPLHELHPVFQLLILFCETASHLLIILDDIELYDQQQPLNLQQLVTTSHFINHFLFKTVWNGLINPTTAEKEVLFTSLHNLLMILYERDCRRSYCPEGHWLITDTKPVVFLQELEKGRKSAKLLLQKMPHIIPHRDRVVLFRKNVTTERETLGLVDTTSLLSNPSATLVTIHRPRLLEDGYRQLGMLPAKALKGLIRVKFINEQGLDEAGIDQDGVFKEFLEETIDKVFDPSLNLFKMTGENQLYPSPLSHLQENHLQLFEFVGRMLGKAVYEGIVVDVPFAPFFLTQMLGNRQGALYSYMDELPSLDPELYKSLTYVKHYEGDIRDLELTFAWDEDIFGKVVTHELIPGGKAVQVTDENKISYVHFMAIFKMYKQIKAQSSAFIRGFKSIVNPDWLATFSGPELQKLISGDNIDIDIEDLKKHTQFYGGFYGGHKVIQWLWDILQKDFSKEERSLFLKFVTSCSKPPLLGFTHMEPPFSIRCVEVSEEQDTGDTVGSVLKGFFRLSKKEPVGRLPTSSTCFNLLKLPNYQKRSTLRDKLRYAISSNTGFELS